MAFYIIAGRNDCSSFIHALQIANYLYERLPNFNIFKICKEDNEWAVWLADLNKERGWHHQGSLIVWKEISMKGGRPYLIGGLSEFWEYIYDYYGLLSTISKADIDAILQERRMLEEEEESNRKDILLNSVNISITGACNPYIRLLLWQILTDAELFKGKYLTFTLYDQDMDMDMEKESFLVDLVEEVRRMFFTEDLKNKKVKLVEGLKQVLQNCDLLIVCDDYVRRETETYYNHKRRCMFELSYLADQMNLYAKRALRVLLIQNEQVCFNASVLIHKCTTIRLCNIVAVTADLGLSALSIVTKQFSIPLEKVYGPPVWGFIGVNCFIDIRNTVLEAEVCKPYFRSVKGVTDSTLAKGEISKELRLMAFMINEELDLENEVMVRKNAIKEALGRYPVFSKVRAVMSLLKCWYSDESNNSIISLGVCSNGTFGIPNGMVFSQPVKFDKESGRWTPFPDIPINNVTREKVSAMVAEASSVLEDVLYTKVISDRFYV